MLTGRPGASLYAVPGDHALTRSPDVVALAATDWLGGVRAASGAAGRRPAAPRETTEVSGAAAGGRA